MHYRLLTVVLTIVCAANCAAPDPINDLLVKLQSTPMDAVLYWNLVTVQATAKDYDQSIVFRSRRGSGSQSNLLRYSLAN